MAGARTLTKEMTTRRRISLFTIASASMVGSRREPLRRAMSRSIDRQLGALMWNGGQRPYGSAMTFGITPVNGFSEDVMGGVPNPRAERKRKKTKCD